MSAGRIAVTGVGLVSALGTTARSTFDALVRGERGFSELSLFDTTGQRSSIAAEVRGFRVQDVAPRGQAERWSRTDALALAAGQDALRSAGLGERRGPARLGIAVGVTTAGMLEAEELLVRLPMAESARRSAASYLSYPISSTASRLSEVLGPAVHVATVCSACSSGANALVQGAAWLRLGSADVVLAGGADALCRLTLTGFNSLGATDSVACRPFDRARAGLTLGEGAGFLVLETEESAVRRGAPVIAWLSGWAVGAEAHHITQPDPSARMPARLLVDAVRSAGLEPADVDYVNAHGTGTVSNDSVETAGIHAAFGDHGRRVLVSSSKGQIGHTLGAAGAVEAAITALAVARQVVPPTGGLAEPDSACALNHVMGSGRHAAVRAAVSSSFGFGGTGAVLLFEQAAAGARTVAKAPRSVVAITAVTSIGPRGVLAGERCAEAFADDGEAPARIPLRPLELLDPARSRRFDVAASLIAASAQTVLAAAQLEPGGVGLAAGSAFGNVERTVAFTRAAVEKGPRRVPPAEFPHLVPSAGSGNASIYVGLTGPVLTTSHLDATAEAAVFLSTDWLEAGLAPGMIAGGAEPYDPFVAEVLGPACEGTPLLRRSEGAAFLLLEPLAGAVARGARPLAVVHRRYELSTAALDAVALEPPEVPSRAFVASARDAAPCAQLLARAGWGSVPRLSVGASTGWHEGAGGVALAAAAARLAAGEADEALVLGWTHARIFGLHLRRAL
jgi:3-oxoacyl-[acyl-carrier-protein] synthase II